MINMYKNVDDTFINLWNRVHTHANPAWLSQLQTQLSEAVPAYFECTETQSVLIRVTQQWLKAQAWQLCVCQGLVSSVASENPQTFKYPIEIARDLLSMTHQFSRPAIEVHGVGLVSKFRLIASFQAFLRNWPEIHISSSSRLLSNPCYISIWLGPHSRNIYL